MAEVRKSLFNSGSRKVHYGVYVRDDMIGRRYRLLCSGGKEVYIPFLVGKWALTSMKVTCENCKRVSDRGVE